MDFWLRLSPKTRLGIVFCILLTIAVVLLLLCHDSFSLTYRNGWWIMSLVPLILVLWLSWSEITKIRWWHWLVIFATLIVCAIKPASWIIGIPLIGYILFVRRKK